MKKHLILTSLAAIIATTGIAGAAEELTMDSIKQSLGISSSDILAKPDASTYTYKLADGTNANMAAQSQGDNGEWADMTAATTAADYADYEVTSAAANNANVKLAEDVHVKLGTEITADSYKYLSKNAEEEKWVSGSTAVEDLGGNYTAYGEKTITVSTGDSEATRAAKVDIANYKETGDNDVVYALVKNADNSYSIYNNGVDVTEAFPSKLETLKKAYEDDVTAVNNLYTKLDGIKADNTANYNAINGEEGIMATDKAAIKEIAANKASWETAADKLSTAVANYDASVATYNNSLGATLDARVVESVVATANMSPVTEPAPDAKSYEYTLADGTKANMAAQSQDDNGEWVDMTEATKAEDYAAYEAPSAAADNKFVALATGSAVKLGETMTEANYTYSYKDASGKAEMVAGTKVVEELTKEYKSDYIDITVSSDSEPSVNIANYKQTADNGTVYKLVQNKDGSYSLDVDGIDLSGDLPNKLAELKKAYEDDVTEVNKLHGELAGYKQYNTQNHNAITGIVAADNKTIEGIEANAASYTTASSSYTADKTAYDAKVDAYNNSLGKVFADKMSMGDVAGKNFDANDNVVAAVSKIDTNMGTIHGLIESADAKTTSNGRAYNGNLAVGTTVEDHLLALDSSIGDLRTLTGQHVDPSKNVALNLQSLNKGIEDETERAKGAELTLQKAINDEATARAKADTALQEQINASFAMADTQILSKANAYTDSKVNKLEKDMSGGVAAATALSAVSVGNVERGEVSVGGGYGYYNGQSAMAFGAAMGLSDSWSINAGAGLASGDSTQFSIRAGTNYKFKLF